MSKIFKKVVPVLLGVILIAAGSLAVISREDVPILISNLQFDNPIETPKAEAISGEYPGERNSLADGKANLDNLQDVDTSKFHVYSYNSTPTVKGKDSNLWIENLSINTYSSQTLIIDTTTNEVIYISPIMKPGTYVDNQKLLTKNIDFTKGYEIRTNLYINEGNADELYNVGIASITFNKES